MSGAKFVSIYFASAMITPKLLWYIQPKCVHIAVAWGFIVAPLGLDYVKMQGRLPVEYTVSAENTKSANSAETTCLEPVSVFWNWKYLDHSSPICYSFDTKLKLAKNHQTGA